MWNQIALGRSIRVTAIHQTKRPAARATGLSNISDLIGSVRPAALAFRSKMEARRAGAFEAGVGPAALALGAEMETGRTGAIAGERMAEALRPAPESGSAILSDLDDRRTAGCDRRRQHRCVRNRRDRQRKRGSQSNSPQHDNSSRAFHGWGEDDHWTPNRGTASQCGSCRAFTPNVSKVSVEIRSCPPPETLPLSDRVWSIALINCS